MEIQKEESKRRDTIEAKIERLKAFAERYPYAFSRVIELKKRLEEEGKPEESEELENLYKSEYTYVRFRKARGKLPEEVMEELKEGRIGGVFKLSKEDEAFREEIGVQEDVIMELMQDFETREQFRQAYIQYRVDLANAVNHEEEGRIVQANPLMLKYQKKLPLIRDFYFGEKETHEKLLRELTYRDDETDSKSWVFDKGIDVAIDDLLQRFPERNRTIFEVQFGLNDQKRETLAALGRKNNISKDRARQIRNETLHKCRRIFWGEVREKLAFEATEEFIRAYFEQYDVWKHEGKIEIREEDRERLVALCREERREEVPQKESVPDPITILEPEMGGIISPLRLAGIKTVTELLQLTPDELIKIRHIGQKVAQKIIDGVHKKGYKFEWEKEEIGEQDEGAKNSKFMMIRDLGLSKKAYEALVRRKIETVSALLKETPDELIRIRHIDPECVQEIIGAVHERGFQFEGKVEKEGFEKGTLDPEMTRIEELHLRGGIYVPLIRMNIQRVSDLLNLTPDELQQIRYIGQKSVQEIIDAVHEKGFQFKYEEEKEIQSSKGEEEEQHTEVVEVLQTPSEISEEKGGKSDNQQDDLKRKVDALKVQKEDISQELKKLLEQLDQEKGVDLNSAVRSTIIETYQLLQEQTKVMQEISLAILDAQKVEKEKQEERANLRGNANERTRGGE